MLAFYDMMKKQIVMPAHLMDDGEHRAKTGRNLFKDFSSVAQSTGTYTGHVSLLIVALANLGNAGDSFWEGYVNY